jgi:hypothetical protein
MATEDTIKGEGAPATDEAKGGDALETDAAPAAAAASEAEAAPVREDGDTVMTEVSNPASLSLA